MPKTIYQNKTILPKNKIASQLIRLHNNISDEENARQNADNTLLQNINSKADAADIDNKIDTAITTVLGDLETALHNINSGG